MNVIFKRTWRLLAAAAALSLAACEKGPAPEVKTGAGTDEQIVSGAELPVGLSGERGGAAGPEVSLEEFSELERAGGFFQGMGLAESTIREDAGDYSGAVIAAYKELAWAYGFGQIQKTEIEAGLEKILSLGEPSNALHSSNASHSFNAPYREEAARSARAALAFVSGRWNEAEGLLSGLFADGEEPDSFDRWMLLVCALEQDNGNRSAGASYRAIRARYSTFPEYWYRGARVFTGSASAEYADRCLALSPQGPFTGECQNILAEFLGLDPRDGKAIKSRAEIEGIITRAVSRLDPEILKPLMPLIALPDNTYTVYAVGALKALSLTPKFRDYFSALASESSGRLAERLAYICKG
ncbi:MAG: hypothetical protein LBN21_09240 [Treponema sp.]|nr:hypothetical protein [Treponema sp.]